MNPFPRHKVVRDSEGWAVGKTEKLTYPLMPAPSWPTMHDEQGLPYKPIGVCICERVCMCGEVNVCVCVDFFLLLNCVCVCGIGGYRCLALAVFDDVKFE